ncbi:MAG: flagellar motor stator protein MotA [Alphaproteobacteria bacterium RIFOXYD12_FULL_60_8]|nr:MAG: flagellar motor stator protein MotA [Alphaproteobacteria bacterium RIFOXYD12_FULL_60_8]
MFVIIGFVTVIGCVIGGYLMAGGHLGVLWVPNEFIIILGAAIGSFLVANPKPVVMATFKSFGPLLKGSKHNKNSYLELLCMLYTVFRLAKTKGDLALESHVEKPEESPIFQKFPGFLADHHTLVFFCDYLRLLTLGTNNAHEVEAIIDAEIESHHHELSSVSSAIATVGDAMPALGIVAAVLGVIHTMGSITEPPEVLGHLIGGALVGTFFGVLCSYGFIQPISKSLEATFASDTTYMNCIKTALLAHMQGYAPQVSVEFARKILPPELTPSFTEVEEAVSNLGST